jgi:hypothetical protein
MVTGLLRENLPRSPELLMRVALPHAFDATAQRERAPYR